MKSLICYISIFALFFSCSPKISSTVNNKQPALADNEFVLILQKEDNFINDGIEIGNVKSTDNGFSSGCTYFEVIETLKKLARTNGANLTK